MRETNAAVAPSDRWPDFAELYREHAAHVHRFCLSQVGGSGAAEDITHETFLRAFGVEAARRPEHNFRPWLIRIARRLCIDHHRRSSRAGRLLARLTSAPAAPASVELVAEERDRLRGVNTELQRLRRRERELIGLRVAADLSYRDIGAILGIGEDAAKVATHRALSRLRSHLEVAQRHDH